MGCQMLVATESESLQTEKRLNDVPSQFADWELKLSRFKPDSELNQLNGQSGAFTPLSQVMWDVLQTAKRAAEDSGGLVTAAVLPHLERAGYVESFERISNGVVSTGSSVRQILESMEAIHYDETARAILLPVGMRLDLGGVVKGWAAHQAMQQLRDLGPVLVDCGGDIAISAPLSSGEAWAIGVNNPLNRGGRLETLYVLQGGIATSGRDHRKWQQGAEWRHHIIDPRTGRPAETDLLSVTVIAEDVMQAEMAAKKVLILGSEAGLDWIDRLDQTAALAILENGELLGSHGIEQYLRN